MKLRLKIGFTVGMLLALAFLPSQHVSAAACGSSNLAFTAAPRIGPTAGQTVTAAKGDTVTIYIQLEDGCGGQVAAFEVYATEPAGQRVKQISVTLDQGTPVSGQPGVAIFKAPWTIDLSNGSYYLVTNKIGSSFGGVAISNTLNVQSTQACNISNVYVSPSSGLMPGQAVQLIVEVKGSCQGWKASLNVLDLNSTKSLDIVFQGSGQDVSSGKVIWGWTIPPLKSGRQSNSYILSANMGTQLDVKSTQFCVGNCSSGTGTGGTSGGGTSGGGGTSSTTGQTYSFNITNPLAGSPDNIFDIINIVTQWIMYISIPLAVLFIMYAGFLMLTAGATPANFQKGRDVLKYTVIGLAIIFIGKGFVSLIISIIELGGSTPTTQTQNLPGSGTMVYGCYQGFCTGNTDPAVYKDFTETSTDPICSNTSCAGTTTNGSQPGSMCNSKAPCLGGLTCKNNICQNANGNFVNEPCAANNNCAKPAICDMLNTQIVDGQTLGTCTTP